MPIQNFKEKAIIIDFGSQVTKLIARRIRELGVLSEILTIKEFKNFAKSYEMEITHKLVRQKGVKERRNWENDV